MPPNQRKQNNVVYPAFARRSASFEITTKVLYSEELAGDGVVLIRHDTRINGKITKTEYQMVTKNEIEANYWL